MVSFYSVLSVAFTLHKTFRGGEFMNWNSTIKVVDRHGNPVVGARVVVTEFMSKSLRRLKEQNRLSTDPMRGTTDPKGYVYMNLRYEFKAEVAIDGRIYGVFLLNTGADITIRIKD